MFLYLKLCAKIVYPYKKKTLKDFALLSAKHNLTIVFYSLILLGGHSLNPLVSGYTCMSRANEDYDIIIRNAFYRNYVTF